MRTKIESHNGLNDVFIIRPFRSATDSLRLRNLHDVVFPTISFNTIKHRLVDNDASYVVEFYGELVGFYILDPTSPLPPNYIDNEIVSRLADLGKGVEGVALAVHPEFQGLGLGNLLKDLPKRLGFNFVWGGADKHLNNIDHWMKRRILVEETTTAYITAEIF